eukprot:TRINITY_DN3328_c0_g1_i1.p1 TRINITY_DN3328_c0_g1~~TRINITY_DN3328_c0_g1_i1.p1  ORF type:complete len:364 (-),score=115.64 TRINITY_DN3328_c0_g1_i1:238-1329(-)
MPRHAKNNTASSVFTYAERQMMDYGTRTERLGVDSLRRITSCALCLQDAVSPMLCPKGHLYCKECIFDCILRQKKDIKERVRIWEEQQRLDELHHDEAQQSRHEAEVDQFDKNESAILPSSSSSSTSSSSSSSSSSAAASSSASASTTTHMPASASSSSGSGAQDLPDGIVCYDTKTGRKYFADDALLSTLSESEWAALEATAESLNEKEHENSSKRLTSFWVPGVTKEAGEGKVKKPSTKTMCPEGSHVLRAKQLKAITFASIRRDREEEGSHVATGVASRFQCPPCRKEITNATRISAIGTCGHVLCNTCIRTLVEKDGQCAVCSKRCTKQDLIPVLSGGTGFAAHGEKLEATKLTPAARV